MRFIKKVIKNILQQLGYDIVAIGKNSQLSPISNMHSFLAHLKRLGFDCATVLDLGAHEGWFYRVAQDIYPNAVFYLIEPLPEMQSNLDIICSENANCKYLPIAVGRTKMMGYITKSSSLSGSSIKDPTSESLQATKTQVPIQIETINSLVNEKKIEIPSLVKMDIEGSELDVLEKSDAIFGKTEVFIIETALYHFREYRPDFFEIVDFLKSQKYVLYDVVGYHRRPFDGALGMLDLVFVKEEGILRKSHRW